MHAQEYLTLRLVRLKSTEEWILNGDGLAFVFLKGGSGHYVSGSDSRSLESRAGVGHLLARLHAVLRGDRQGAIPGRQYG